MRRVQPVVFFCLLVAYLAFFYQLGNLAFVGADEPRYARIAEEMLQSGDWVTPRLNSVPWLEKPPLLFWLEAVSFRVFGIGEATSRLPSAFLALATALATALFARFELGVRAGVVTFMILCTSGLFFTLGRAASTDMPLVACLSGAMMAGFITSQRNSLPWGLLTGGLLGLAVLAKGPVAMVLFAGAFLAYSFLQGRPVWSWKSSLALVGALVAVSAPWFWLIWKANGYNFLATFLLNHHLARFLTDIHHHRQPVWYFVPVLLIGFFPWVFFLGSAARRAAVHLRVGLKSSLQNYFLFLWLWALVPFVFFSLSVSKLSGYILPVLPPLAVLVAYEWERHVHQDVTTYRLMKIQLAVTAASSICVSLVLLFGAHFRYNALLTGFWLALPLAIIPLWIVLDQGRQRPEVVLVGLVAAMTLLAAVAYWQLAPVLNDFHSTRDIVTAVKSELSKDNPLVFYKYFHHTATYYSDYQTNGQAIADADGLASYIRASGRRTHLILTQENGWQDLTEHFAVRLRSKEGNVYLVELKAP